MVQHFCYFIETIGTDGERHEIVSDHDFKLVQDLFFKLAQLELPVSISYDSWWTRENEEE